MTDYAGDERRLCDKCRHGAGSPACKGCDGVERFEAEAANGGKGGDEQ